MDGGKVDTIIPESQIQQSPELPDKLQNILNALADYHKSFLHKNTLNGQEPSRLEDIRNYLKEVCCQICDYIEDPNNIPSFFEDPDFEKMFTILQENTNDWDYEVSILVPYWCNLMFVQYPFSISQQHIENLIKNSKKSNVDSDDI